MGTMKPLSPLQKLLDLDFDLKIPFSMNSDVEEKQRFIHEAKKASALKSHQMYFLIRLLLLRLRAWIREIWNQPDCYEKI